MFTLNRDKYKGYCGKPYKKKYLDGSKCARYCHNVSYGRYCAVKYADSNRQYRVKGKSGRGGKWDTQWKDHGFFSTSTGLTCGGRFFDSSE